MPDVYHAIGVSMHQPPGNLIEMHNSEQRHEVKQILWCYDRVTRMLEGYEDVARLMMMFSGTLLKQLEEAATLMRLGHPNVVGVHEVGEMAGSPFFIMDYVAGKSLDRIIES